MFCGNEHRNQQQTIGNSLKEQFCNFTTFSYLNSEEIHVSFHALRLMCAQQFDESSVNAVNRFASNFYISSSVQHLRERPENYCWENVAMNLARLQWTFHSLWTLMTELIACWHIAVLSWDWVQSCLALWLNIEHMQFTCQVIQSRKVSHKLESYVMKTTFHIRKIAFSHLNSFSRSAFVAGRSHVVLQKNSEPNCAVKLTMLRNIDCRLIDKIVDTCHTKFVRRNEQFLSWFRKCFGNDSAIARMERIWMIFCDKWMASIASEDGVWMDDSFSAT